MTEKGTQTTVATQISNYEHSRLLGFKAARSIHQKSGCRFKPQFARFPAANKGQGVHVRHNKQRPSRQEKHPCHIPFISNANTGEEANAFGKKRIEMSEIKQTRYETYFSSVSYLWARLQKSWSTTCFALTTICIAFLSTTPQVANSMEPDSAKEPVTTPYAISFPLAEENKKITFDIKIQERGVYYFCITFVDPYNSHNEHRAAIIKAVGHGGVINNEQIDDGYPLEINLQIDHLTVDNNTYISEAIKKLPSIALSGGGTSTNPYLRHRLIKDIILTPGMYKISIRNINTAYELAWIKTLLTIHRRITK